jgi:hypothetical protein
MARKFENLNFDKDALYKVIKQYGGEASWFKDLQNYKTKPSNTYENISLGVSSVPTMPKVEVNVPLVHNNMVPFYGGSSKQSMDIDNRRISDNIDLFTGQFRLNQEHKVETGTLFAPTPQHLTSVEAPRGADVMELYNSSCTIRNGERPMEQIHVASGLNDGFTDKGSGGFHPTLRIRPQTTEERSVNPKVTFEGRIIQGKDHVNNRPSAPNLVQYKAHVLVDNTDGRYDRAEPADVKRPMIYAPIVLKNTNRKCAKMMTGFAGNTRNDSLPCNRQPKIKLSTKVSFKDDTRRNIGNAEYQGGNGIDKVGKTTTRAMREADNICWEKRGIFGEAQPVPKSINYVYQPARETKAQHLLSNQLGIAGTSEATANQNRPEVIMDMTMRETYEDNKHTGIIKGADGQITYDPTDVPEPTLREGYENNKRSANLTGDHIVSKEYLAVDKPKGTLRELTEYQDYLGNVNSEYLQDANGYTTAPVDLKNTQRQTYSDYFYAGDAGKDIGCRLYDSAYDMRQNLQKEIVAKGRYPVPSNVDIPTGADMVNLNVNRQNALEYNRITGGPQLLQAGGERKPMSTCELTKTRNLISSRNPSFDPDILSAFNRNPLTQSLQSWA